MDDKVKIVTAFVDLDRENWVGVKNGKTIPSYIKRSVDEYLERFNRLTLLNNEIFVYVESSFKQRLLDYIGDKPNVTVLEIDEHLKSTESLEKKIEKIQKSPYFIDMLSNPSSPEYWNPKYVIINFLKTFLIHRTIDQKLIDINDRSVAWIDFGYAREDDQAPAGKTFRFETDMFINVFSNGELNDKRKEILETEPIINIVRSGMVLLQGCHIIAPANTWHFLWQANLKNLLALIDIGLVDDDQTFLLMSCRMYAKIFRVMEGDGDNWFKIIKDNCYEN
jgi:protein YibB